MSHPVNDKGKSMEENKERIKAYISPYLEDYELENEEDIFALGIVNSLFAMQLVLFVEKEFQINIDNEDLDIQNFRSVNSIADLVARKRNSQNHL